MAGAGAKFRFIRCMNSLIEYFIKAIDVANVQNVLYNF